MSQMPTQMARMLTWTPALSSTTSCGAGGIAAVDTAGAHPGCDDGGGAVAATDVVLDAGVDDGVGVVDTGAGADAHTVTKHGDAVADANFDTTIGADANITSGIAHAAATPAGTNSVVASAATADADVGNGPDADTDMRQ